ncbi:hypothetical protein BDV96DRAFT_580833 [Lophiotrema nucula]|uniref:3'-5' exonuclease domain-containing protein n=1 Tax=Lophiotrema nucula TaxID=690887 RepID=A0A6A5Z0V4_9PLEO|nr:hypothetical protein BDV96DRAFT_580833 [Lophiotrema nucula]
MMDMLQSLEEETSLGHAAVLQIMQPLHLYLTKIHIARFSLRQLPSLFTDLAPFAYPETFRSQIRSQFSRIERGRDATMEGFRSTIHTEFINFQAHLESKSVDPNFAKRIAARSRSIRQSLVASILRYKVVKHPRHVGELTRFGYEPSRWIKRMYRQVRDQGFPISMREPLRFQPREVQSARAKIRKALARARKARAAIRKTLNSKTIKLILPGRALLAKDKARMETNVTPSIPAVPKLPRPETGTANKPKVRLKSKDIRSSVTGRAALRQAKGGPRTKGGGLLFSSKNAYPTLARPERGAASKAQAIAAKHRSTSTPGPGDSSGTFTIMMFAPSPQVRVPHSLVTFTDPPLNAEYVISNGSANIIQCTDDGFNPPPPGKPGSYNSSSSGNDGENKDNKGSRESRNNPKKMHDEQEPNDGEDGPGPNDEGGVEAAFDNVLEAHTSLSYQIPTESLRVAMQASENTLARHYSHALYRGPEDQRISLHYCRNKEIAERVAKYFLEEKVVGFDIEWKPFAPPWSIKENASLIQLACEDRIALFHISLFNGKTAEQLLPQSLKQIIESPDILKAGVNIKGDFTRLEKFLKVKPQGRYELSRLHNVVEYTLTDPSKVNNRLVSLATQVHQHLLLPLHKGEVRESDWSKSLSPEQLSYAFTDAYAGFRLFDALEAKRKMLRPIPPRPPVTDFDPTPKIRDGPRPKRVKKPAAPRIVDASEKELEVEKDVDEGEDEDDVYETAVEELPESEDDEASSASESSLESSKSFDGPDADFVPRVRHAGRDPVDLDGAADEVEPVGRRIGRLRLSQSAISDPGYPKLPIDSSVEVHDAQGVETQVMDEDKTASGSFAVNLVEDMSSAQTTDESTSNLQAAIEPGEYGIPSDEEQEMAALVAKLEVVDERQEDTDVVPNDNYQPFVSASILEHAAAPTQPHRSVQFRPVQATDDTPRTREYTLADTWANEYLVSSIPSPSITSGFSRIRATMPHLRAYHLWHYQGLQVDEVARHLRDPPLSENTVCGYILQAVNMERLECDKERGREVLALLPLSVRMSRFRGLSERLNTGKK